MIKLRDVSKFYISNDVITKALDSVSLDFDKNGLVVVKGESGSGKSTLLKIISRDIYCDSGTVDICGCDITSVYQDFKLIEAYTAYENVYLVASMFYDSYSAKNKVVNVLKALGLEQVLNHRVNRLSTGQRQRVAVARALVSKSNVIILDEPTANLDDSNTKCIFELLKEYSKDRLIILSTHNSEMEIIADRIVTIGSGKVISDESYNEALCLNEQICNKNSISNRYLICKNYFRYPWVNFFSAIIVLIMIFTIAIGAKVISDVNKAKFDTTVLGITDNRCLVSSKNCIDKAELDDTGYKYSINPFYIGENFEFNNTNGSDYISVSYEEERLSSVTYGRLPSKEDEACLYVNTRSKSLYYKKIINTEYYLGDTGETFKIVGVLYTNKVNGTCLAYNDMIKNYMIYSKQSYYINDDYVDVSYGMINKIVLPVGYHLDSMYSIYYSHSFEYKMNYSFDVEYQYIEKPYICLSLSTIIDSDDIYEALVFSNSKKVTKIDANVLNLEKYNTSVLTKEDAEKRVIKSALLVVAMAALEVVLYVMYRIVMSFQADFYSKIDVLDKNKSRVIKFIDFSLKGIASIAVMTIVNLFMLGLSKALIVDIIFVVISIFICMKMVEKAGENNVKAC